MSESYTMSLIQSFCAKAVRGTIISVEEVNEILTSKTVNGYPDGWWDGGWEEGAEFLGIFEDWAEPPVTADVEEPKDVQSPKRGRE